MTEVRKRPGPTMYPVGASVEVKIKVAPNAPMAWVPAHVVHQSRTHLKVNVIGSGATTTLTKWDVKLFVRGSWDNYQR